MKINKIFRAGLIYGLAAVASFGVTYNVCNELNAEKRAREQAQESVNYFSRNKNSVVAPLLANIGPGDTSLDLIGRNPFAPNGGIIMVGDEASGYEVMRYTSSNNLTLDGLLRGQYGTSPRAHLSGEIVYFARVVQIDMTGLTRRVK